MMYFCYALSSIFVRKTSKAARGGRGEGRGTGGSVANSDAEIVGSSDEEPSDSDVRDCFCNIALFHFVSFRFLDFFFL